MSENENKESSYESDQTENQEHFNEDGLLKAREKYEVNGYNYETDSKGRIKHCEGDLRLEDAPRNLQAQAEAGGEDRRRGAEMDLDEDDVDDGGHLIATRFGGSGELDNIVAMNRNLNRGEYKHMENDWANTLSEKNEKGEAANNVHVDINCRYSGDSQRPDSITVRYQYIDRETNETYYENTERFKNEPIGRR